MQSLFYYSDRSDRDNNFRNDSVYLQVNCAGRAVYAGAVGRSIRRDLYLLYLTKGTITVSTPAPGGIMKAGDLIIFSSDTPFDYTGLADNQSLVYYWVHFTGYAAEEIIRDCGIRLNEIEHIGILADIPDAFSSLFSAFTHVDNMTDLDKSNRLVSLLVSIGRHIPQNSGANQSYIKGSKVIRDSVNYIHDNISSDLKVDKLALREYLSPGRYRELFRALTGCSPKEYIISLRMNIACELLSQTDMPICEISLAVGLPDQRYFSRIFMKMMGVTPGSYRKSNQTV